MSATRMVPLDALRDELTARYAPPARSRAALAKLRHAFDQLARAGVATTADLDAVAVARLIDSRPAGESPSTTRNLLAMVRVISTYAAEEGYCDGSPFYGRGPWVRRETRQP